MKLTKKQKQRTLIDNRFCTIYREGVKTFRLNKISGVTTQVDSYHFNVVGVLARN